MENYGDVILRQRIWSIAKREHEERKQKRSEWKLTLMSCVVSLVPYGVSWRIPNHDFRCLYGVSAFHCQNVIAAGFVFNTLQFVEWSYMNVWRVEKSCSVWYNQCWGKRTKMSFVFNYKFQHTKTNQSSNSYFQDICISKNFRRNTSQSGRNISLRSWKWLLEISE
jgi:hypothetical protein